MSARPMDGAAKPRLKPASPRGIRVKPNLPPMPAPWSTPVERLQIESLTLDPEIQQRVATDEALVEDYAEGISDWIESAPITVVAETDTRWVADGFHRVLAARRAALQAIPARVQAGTRHDALLIAIGANASHGLRRSAEDKRRALDTLLADSEWARWSDRRIADLVGISPTTVGTRRAQLSKLDSSIAQPEHRIGADGRKRRPPDPTIKPGKVEAKPAPDPTPEPSGDDDKVVTEALPGSDLPPIRATTAKPRALERETPTPQPRVLDVMRAMDDLLASHMAEPEAKLLIRYLRAVVDRLTTCLADSSSEMEGTTR